MPAVAAAGRHGLYSLHARTHDRQSPRHGPRAVPAAQGRRRRGAGATVRSLGIFREDDFAVPRRY